MVFRIGYGFFSSQINIQKRVWHSSTTTLFTKANNDLKTTALSVKHPVNFKVTKIDYSKPQEISFEEFKKTKVESFEEFQNSTSCKLLYNNDMEEIKKAYEAFCQQQYFSYKRLRNGYPLFD